MLDVLTFGCRLNAYESEVMRGLASAAGLDDAVIVNTCAVTSEAERQARQAIRKARRERPESRIIVTGCAAQIAPDRYASMPEVDAVVGNAEKLTADAFAPRRPRVRVGDIMTVRETAAHLIDGFAAHTRAIVQEQQGCDHRCTFCVIPLGRGNSRSVPVGEVVRQVRHLVEGGSVEVVLSGVDATAYGADLPGRPSLGQMVRRVLTLVPDLKRLRLSSLDPSEIDPELWRLIAEEPRLMPHLHLSLQSGDDLILRRMKRRHRRADAVGCCHRARDLRPDIAFGADVIAGFPTETDAMFEATESLIAACGLSYLHVFPYSERPGTPAARMPQVPAAIRRQRAKRLRDAGRVALTRHLEARVGRRLRVVVEKPGMARAEDFTAVRLDAPAPPVGTLATVVATVASTDCVVGRLTS